MIVTRKHKRCRGMAMVLALVAVAVVALIAFSLVQALFQSRHQARLYQDQAQAMWLADSALARGAARLRIDSSYSGETWLPSSASGIAGSADGPSPAPLGRAVIRVEADESSPATKVIVVEAFVPDRPIKRVRQTRQQTMSLKPTGESP